LRKCYPTMYVPSDFFHVGYDWPDSVPAGSTGGGFSLKHDVMFHVLHKDVDDPAPLATAVIDPPDADYRFSAKVGFIIIYCFCFFGDMTV